MAEDNLLTTNTNLLQTTKFQLVFTRIPNVVYFLTEVNLPGVSLLSNTQPTPFRDVPVPGDKLDWEELDIVFNIDENLNNWSEIFRWMQGLGKPQDYNQYQRLKTKSSIYSDASLILNTSHNNAQYRIAFSQCWPSKLTSIPFTTTGSANDPLIGRASFNYTYYEIEKIQ